MDVQTFWDLIESAAGDGQRLASFLQEKAAEDVRGFGDLLDVFHNKAYNCNLWAAAYLINGGCSEEEFHQFIYWLIGKGKEKYEKSVEDPDALAEIVQDEEITFNEDIIIAIARSLDRLGKGIEGKSNVIIPAELMEHKDRPRKPRGKEWEADEELLEMFPKLADRFGDMLEWEEEEEEEWDDEDKDKSKLRRAWDKFVEFFARIFDKFLKIFRKKKKEVKEEEEAEPDSNRLNTNFGLNFWLYLSFLVLFLGFIALIPITVVIQTQIAEDIAALKSVQTHWTNIQDIFFSWEYLTDTIIQRRINKLTTRQIKWGELQPLWSIFAVLTLIAGLPLIKLIIQPRNVNLNSNEIEFLNRKEVVIDSIEVKEIESIQISKSNTIQILPKKNSDKKPIILIDLKSVKNLKKFCVEQKIVQNEESILWKMLWFQSSDKIKRLLKHA